MRRTAAAREGRCGSRILEEIVLSSLLFIVEPIRVLEVPFLFAVADASILRDFAVPGCASTTGYRGRSSCGPTAAKTVIAGSTSGLSREGEICRRWKGK